MFSVDQYPVESPGIYEDFESTSQFSGYVWSDWTTKTVQPMHVDEALRAMIDKPARNSAGATMASSQPSTQPNVMANDENKGSGGTTSVAMPSPPEPSCDASMAASSDKRTREPPDTTTKPEGVFT